MEARTLAVLAIVACAGRNLSATSCGRLPPCATVRPESILFTGTVTDSVALPGNVKSAGHESRVKVHESFHGLPLNSKEVIVVTENWQLTPGQEYLFDVGRGDDGRYYPGLCGNTAEIGSEYIADVLEHLRKRAQGKTAASLTVDVRDNYKPVSGVEVTVSGPGGRLTKPTGSDGAAGFFPITPGHYSVAVQKSHYRLDDSAPEHGVEVTAGSCASTSVGVQADSAVSGLVLDANGSPMAALDLELVSTPKHPTDDVSLDNSFFVKTTDAAGLFSFEGVSPGTYLLGSNIIGLNSSSVPPTFYPGTGARNAAVPIRVNLGENTGNLVFNVPDLGAPREIQICVVDENGRPAAEVDISSNQTDDKPDSARLAENLVTGSDGCVAASGYARVSYPVSAFLQPPDRDIRRARFSDTLVVPAGGPFHGVIKLRPPVAPAKVSQP